MKRFLCIWPPNWPIQRLAVRHSRGSHQGRQGKPQAKQKPVVVHAPHPRRGQCVSACSLAAQQHGVAVGMTLAEATALLQTPAPRQTPSASSVSSSKVECFLLKEHDVRADLAVLKRLAQWCDRYSPSVAMETSSEDVREACLLLDVTGIGVLFGGENALAHSISAALAEYGLRVRLAIADTLGAAWAAAHYGYEEASPLEVVIVPPHQSGAWLGPLPVEALRLSSATLAALHRLGITRIEQLARLPRDGLAARFRDSNDAECLLLKRLDQAMGAAEELLVCHRPPPEFFVEQAMEHPAEHRQQVERIVDHLLGRLTGDLYAHNRGAVQIRCRLDCGVGPRLIRFALFEPTACARHLMELAQMQLEQLCQCGPIGRIRIEAPLTAPLPVRQGELFGERSRKNQQSRRCLAMLIDRLAARLGEEQVLRPRFLADAQPERACDYTPLARPLVAEAANPNLKPLVRPLQLHDPPLRLPVIAVAPDGPPVRFRYHYAWRQAARSWGPERIETGWWRGKSVRRDYYRVETDAGRRFWLFRQLDDGAWFLQGVFD